MQCDGYTIKPAQTEIIIDNAYIIYLMQVTVTKSLGKCDCHEQVMASLALTSYTNENAYFSVSHTQWMWIGYVKI